MFIPVDQFDLIQKYAMEEGQRAPSLSRIGGTAWAKTKAKARKAIQDMTEELLRKSDAAFHELEALQTESFKVIIITKKLRDIVAPNYGRTYSSCLGHYLSGVIAADGKVYLGTGRQTFWILKAGKQLEVINRIRMGDGVYSTPVAANGVLYVMTNKHLYAVGKKR